MTLDCLASPDFTETKDNKASAQSRHRSRTPALIAIPVLAAFVLVGCTSPQSSSGTPTGSSDSDSEAVAEPTKELAPSTPVECTAITLAVGSSIDGDQLSECLIASAIAAGSYGFELVWQSGETIQKSSWILNLEQNSSNNVYVIGDTRSEVRVIGDRAWGDGLHGAWNEVDPSSARTFIKSSDETSAGSIFTDNSFLDFTVESADGAVDGDVSEIVFHLVAMTPTENATAPGIIWESATLDITGDFEPRVLQAIHDAPNGNSGEKSIVWSDWGTVGELTPPV
ncbi:hypothetical protein FB472_1195 [Rhodoglobus vestalii]|uniref:Uncharacterized protein n=1 Tax=Rhodoglobus vestalii TaxID=193384 RepID=A0A8H2PUG3_9MICO|nr:hypothetical protein FB472_1195 [Rhodoglobus vestalii]